MRIFVYRSASRSNLGIRCPVVVATCWYMRPLDFTTDWTYWRRILNLRLITYVSNGPIFSSGFKAKWRLSRHANDLRHNFSMAIELNTRTMILKLCILAVQIFTTNKWTLIKDNAIEKFGFFESRKPNITLFFEMFCANIDEQILRLRLPYLFKKKKKKSFFKFKSKYLRRTDHFSMKLIFLNTLLVYSNTRERLKVVYQPDTKAIAMSTLYGMKLYST